VGFGHKPAEMALLVGGWRVRILCFKVVWRDQATSDFRSKPQFSHYFSHFDRALSGLQFYTVFDFFLLARRYEYEMGLLFC